MNDGYYGNNRLVRPPLFRETDVVLTCVGCGAILILLYIATTRWYFSMRQIQEIAAYLLLTFGFSYLFILASAHEAPANTGKVATNPALAGA